ncbi:MAG: biopolymer transporter ExbD [Candidatus Firestonebacteria bacterium]
MKRKRRDISIPVVSMADIAFLLLIFLMVPSITSTKNKKTIHLNLPKVEDATKVSMKKSDDIFITKEGGYFYQGKESTLDEINEKLSTKTVLNKNIVVFVHSDEDTEYEYINRVIEILQFNQLQNCVFVSKKIKK